MHFLIDAPFFTFSLLSYPFGLFFLRALFLSGNRSGAATFSRRVHQQGLLGPPEVVFGIPGFVGFPRKFWGAKNAPRANF